MRLFGHFDESQGFNAVEFAATNYKGFLAAVAPEIKPNILFASSPHEQSTRKKTTRKSKSQKEDRLLPFSGIYETPVTIETPAGEKHHFPWALSIDIMRGDEIDAAFFEADLDESLNILWQLYGCIFRDVRTTLFVHRKVSDLLSRETIMDIQLYSPPVAAIVEFSLEKDRAIQPHHIDAALVGRISSLRWLHEVTENDAETFSEAEIRRLLLLTQRSFSQNPHQWIGFLNEHDTSM